MTSQYQPFGYQSGDFSDAEIALYYAQSSTSSSSSSMSSSSSSSMGSELYNDDSYAGSMVYDPRHNIIYFTGQTYGVYFDSATDLNSDVKDEMGMAGPEYDVDLRRPHLDTGDCFLGALKLPAPGGGGRTGPELIYARRFGTSRNAEACSSIIALPDVNDALLQTSAQVKLALLGHVNPTPLTVDELSAMGYVAGDDGGGARRRDLGDRSRRRHRARQRRRRGEGSSSQSQSRSDGDDGMNRGGLFHTLLGGDHVDVPITEAGRAYGFVADFDVSLTTNGEFTPFLPNDTGFVNAYGALLGGGVLDGSERVYPIAMTQNGRDPNQIYVVSMHSDDDYEDDDDDVYDDDEGGGGGGDVLAAPYALNPEYTANYALEQEIDGVLRERADMTMGGAGMGYRASDLVGGGVPKYGNNFYVKVQQLKVTPYQDLMDVEPTPEERVKRTMNAGWGFGFKLNDANDVRPSSIVFVRGRTPDDDVLLLGGTTRKDGIDGRPDDLDGFITKIIPPAPTPVDDLTTGSDLEGAMESESTHPTQRIDSTTGRDETVTSICLPPPDPSSGLVSHAYIVGSSAAGHDPSQAYIVKLLLRDLSIMWKQHVPSVHPSGGTVGDVLGEGCAVSPDGTKVFLSGTIDGTTALDTRIMSNTDAIIRPVGGRSDVFVIAYDVDFGNVQWAKQLGTANEDKLARGGGIECDNGGNVIIMGSSRGGLQRHRPDEDYPHAPSDIFIMSLSGANGGYVNAPYVSGRSDGAPVSMSAANKGLSAGAVAGISVAAIIIFCVLLFVGLRRRLLSRNKSGDVLRLWNSGDDFTFGDRPSGNGRGRFYEKSPVGALRIVRGVNDDDWDDGSESVSRNATWMSQGRGIDSDTGSVRSMGSNSSKRSYKSKHQDENSNFIASLRQEANCTMKKMVKEPSSSLSMSSASDPRLDGGASIKSLLSHYREVKKETLFDGDTKVQGERGGEGGVTNATSRKIPPPPPPPRKKNTDQASPGSSVGSGNGLSEFTII